MPSVVITKTIQLTVHECQKCGVPFAFSDELYEGLRKSGGFYHCPNGHGWGWGEGTTAAKLKQETERADRLVAHLDREKAARQQAENAVLDKVKEIKRMQRRAKAGVCQECKRTFQNVSRHMETQHAV